jgi:hypothetical protein
VAIVPTVPTHFPVGLPGQGCKSEPDVTEFSCRCPLNFSVDVYRQGNCSTDRKIHQPIGKCYLTVALVLSGKINFLISGFMYFSVGFSPTGKF